MTKILVSLIHLAIFSLITVACTQTAPPATLDIPATVESQVTARMDAVPTVTPYPTATPRPTYTLFPTPTPRPTYTPFLTPTPRPTYTPFPTPTVAQSPTATPPLLSIAESRIYRDFHWGSYSIRLPQGWIVGNEIEPGYTGVSLTQFLAPDAEMGFFITVEDFERTAPGISITLGQLAHDFSNLRRKNGYTSKAV